MTGNNARSLPQDLLITKRSEISLLDSNDFGANITYAVQAVPVPHCQIMKPTNKGKGQQAFDKRLIKQTEDFSVCRKRFQFSKKVHSLLAAFNKTMSINIPCQMAVKSRTQILESINKFHLLIMDIT